MLTESYSNVDQSSPPDIQVLLKEDIKHSIRKDLDLHQTGKGKIRSANVLRKPKEI